MYVHAASDIGIMLILFVRDNLTVLLDGAGSHCSSAVGRGQPGGDLQEADCIREEAEGTLLTEHVICCLLKTL